MATASRRLNCVIGQSRRRSGHPLAGRSLRRFGPVRGVRLVPSAPTRRTINPVIVLVCNSIREIARFDPFAQQPARADATRGRGPYQPFPHDAYDRAGHPRADGLAASANRLADPAIKAVKRRRHDPRSYGRRADRIAARWRHLDLQEQQCKSGTPGRRAGFTRSSRRCCSPAKACNNDTLCCGANQTCSMLGDGGLACAP